MSYSKVRIIIECNEPARQDLEPLLDAFKWCGDVGASRDFEIEELGDGLDRTYGFDGDGPSSIESVTVETLDTKESTTMTPNDISRELSRIANAYPDMANDLYDACAAVRRVAAHQSRHASQRRVANESLHETLTSFCTGLAQVSQKILRKVGELTAHRVSESNHWAEATLKATRTRYRVQFGIDACDLDTVLVVVIISQEGDELRRMEIDGALDAAEIAEQACDALLDELGL